MFFLLCIVSGSLIGMQGIVYKLASQRGSNNDSFRMALCWIAVLLVFGIAVFSGEALRNPVALFYGAVAGACYYLALTGIMRAVEIGPVALTWLLANLSIAVPILISCLIWKEPIGKFRLIGIAFFALSLVLFARDVKGTTSARVSAKWATVTAVMFFANGLVLFLFKWIDQRTSMRHTFTTLLAMYVSAAALSTVRWSLRKKQMKNIWRLAAGGAVCMLGGQALIIEAVKVNTAVALPLIHGVSVMFVAGFSAWLFRERFSFFSGAGLLTGIFAIVLLVLG